MHLDLTLVFERSWRIGSGQAAGRHLDELVRTDGRGLPFVPGSTLRGLVADAARTLAGALGMELCDGTLTRGEGKLLGRLCGVTPGDGMCPLCVLTGSNFREGAVAFEPARLVLGGGGEAEARPEDRRRLAEAAATVPGLLTRRRARTAIDEWSGRADDRKLFALEEAAAGLELSATLRIADADPDLEPRHLALLVAALRFLREVGGGRRRGFGRCRVRIDGADLSPAFGSWREAVESLGREQAPGEDAPLVGVGAGREPAAPARPRPRELPALLAVEAEVVGELALGGRPEAGNLVPGLAYVPGSTLRGALAARWQGDRGSEAFRRAFLSGRVRFGYLYPEDAQAAALPVPLSLRTCKLRPGAVRRGGHGFVDLLEEPWAEHCPQEGCSGRLVPWDRGFQGQAEEPAEGLAVSPHNRIERRSQTVVDDGLFAYQVLPEGRRLRGYLRAESGEDMALLLDGLGLEPGEPFPLRVGRRKGALGYLRCFLAAYAGTDGGVGLFPAAPEIPGRWREGEALRIDLLTPAIVLDRFLGYRESLAPADLGLERRAFDDAFARSQILAGWHGAHRLPKGDEVAVRAGSCYLLLRPESGADGELRALAEAARRGIGRRRAEGFGVVAVRRVAAPGAGTAEREEAP